MLFRLVRICSDVWLGDDVANKITGGGSGRVGDQEIFAWRPEGRGLGVSTSEGQLGLRHVGHVRMGEVDMLNKG